MQELSIMGSAEVAEITPHCSRGCEKRWPVAANRNQNALITIDSLIFWPARGPQGRAANPAEACGALTCPLRLGVAA